MALARFLENGNAYKNMYAELREYTVHVKGVDSLQPHLQVYSFYSFLQPLHKRYDTIA